MKDYDVGYCKPPMATRFKPGKSANPKGRPRHDPSLGKIVKDVFEEPVEYSVSGHKRTMTTREFAIRMLIQRAIEGDVEAADILLRKRARALRRSGAVSKQLMISDWLPDYPGQTAAEKNRVLESKSGGNVVVAEAVTSLHPPEAGGDSNSGVTESVDESVG